MGRDLSKYLLFKPNPQVFLSFKLNASNLQELHGSKTGIRGAPAVHVVSPCVFFCFFFRTDYPTGILNLIQFAESSRPWWLQKGEFLASLFATEPGIRFNGEGKGKS